jgi:hypothetical protein
MPIDRGGRWLGRGWAARPTRRLGPSFRDRRLGDMSRPFKSASFSTTRTVLTGITKDSGGAALASCVVQLFRTVDDLILAETTSDGSGVYVFYPTVGGPFYIVAYKAGAPDAAGTTVNTLDVVNG